MKNSKSSMLNTIMLLFLAVVVWVLVMKYQKLNKNIKRMSKEEKPKIAEKEVKDAVVWYMENNPKYITDFCIPHINSVLLNNQEQQKSPEIYMMELRQRYDEYIVNIHNKIQNQDIVIANLHEFIRNALIENVQSQQQQNYQQQTQVYNQQQQQEQYPKNVSYECNDNICIPIQKINNLNENTKEEDINTNLIINDQKQEKEEEEEQQPSMLIEETENKEEIKEN